MPSLSTAGETDGSDARLQALEDSDDAAFSMHYSDGRLAEKRSQLRRLLDQARSNDQKERS